MMRKNSAVLMVTLAMCAISAATYGQVPSDRLYEIIIGKPAITPPNGTAIDFSGLLPPEGAEAQTLINVPSFTADWIEESGTILSRTPYTHAKAGRVPGLPAFVHLA